MYYVSTRNKEDRRTAAEAIAQGLAVDGGLMTPEVFPKLSHNALDTMRDMSYQQRAVYVMNSYLDDFTASELSAYADKAYGGEKFDVKEVAPVRAVDENTYCLELWHGPTCAFKDMALQMLPHLLSASLVKNQEEKTVCILVATSGDTGKAALEGFKDVDKTRILVFYPKDGVSAIQELQMNTQEGDNVGVCSVAGNFDDAQTGVKRLFSDEALREKLAGRGFFLSSANSINWGRVLPQIVYYISAYCDLLREGRIQKGERINVCVPTGNFGNILAAYYAREMGVPIGRLICASNSNNVLTDFLCTGVYDRNRTFYNTMSPSMDILISSNLERLIYLSTGCDAAADAALMKDLSEKGSYTVTGNMRQFMSDFRGGFATEAQNEATIRKIFEDTGYLIDTHTGVAATVYNAYKAETGDQTKTVIASTASPYKFSHSVLEAIKGKSAVEGKDEFAVVDELSEVSGTPVPKAVEELRSAVIRHNTECDVDKMGETVKNILGIA
mgnify:CR=1 FL=1